MELAGVASHASPEGPWWLRVQPLVLRQAEHSKQGPPQGTGARGPGSASCPAAAAAHSSLALLVPSPSSLSRCPLTVSPGGTQAALPPMLMVWFTWSHGHIRD
ncbi:unnamed protein product [Pipistrellus nathusii]|uniref:Uncharacterized protein n=1 Tax=Pipistrellus nathusii TaxID=59473 RepID=A0ABP0A752_PIPNA